jgi:hypothetical protein
LRRRSDGFFLRSYETGILDILRAVNLVPLTGPMDPHIS